MINPFTEIKWKPGAEDLRKFGRTVFAGFLIISVIIFSINIILFKYQVFKSAYIPLTLLMLGGVVYLISYCIKQLALPVYYIWFLAGATMGIVISNLLLALFFYFVFTPIGLVLRYLTERDPLNIRQIKNQKSKWINHSENKSLTRYFKQY